MDGEYKYRAECDVCGGAISLRIYEEEETPSFCPLCGNDVEYEYKDSDYN